MENLLNLREFLENSDLQSDSYGNYKFQGRVNYLSNIKNVVEYSEIRMIFAGFDAGKISIAEIGELNIDEFHLDFQERFQKYVYDKSNQELIIQGNSPKMNGDYKVKISIS